LTERDDGYQDRIELRRLERGRISARWYTGRVLHDAATVTEEQLVGLLLSWPQAPLGLHGRAIVFTEKLWAEGFAVRVAAE
jgi:hypothetical protein